jgi:hypothetical protein
MLAFIKEETQKTAFTSLGNIAFMIPKRTHTVAFKGSKTG